MLRAADRPNQEKVEEGFKDHLHDRPMDNQQHNGRWMRKQHICRISDLKAGELLYMCAICLVELARESYTAST